MLIILPVLASAQIADSAQRMVKLQGAINFRDLGGYATQDGRQVKWGKLYRSAAINQLTSADLDTLAQRRIAYVVDFRGPREVAAAPDKLPPHAQRISLPAGSENIGDSGSMKKMLQSPSLVPYYSDLSSFTARYKPLFDELLQLPADSALLFHCTAGKDRTGIAAALILAALGVDEQTILGDYTATNYYRKAENERSIQAMQKAYGMPEEKARLLMAADPAYLQATFQAIQQQYGSMQQYLQQEMGLTDARQQQLKALYLENR